jgi:RND family efflux transporter MFP subunit
MSRWAWCWTVGIALFVALGVPAGYFLVRSIFWSSASASDLADAAETEAPAEPTAEVCHPVAQADRTTTQPGSAECFKTARLFAQVTGKLRFTVDIDKEVKVGDVLARIDVPDLDKQLEQRQAGVQRARSVVTQMKARVDTAKAELDAANAAVVYATATARSKAHQLRFRDIQLQRYVELRKLKSAVDERLLDEAQEQRDMAEEARNAAEAGVDTAKANVVAKTAKVTQAEADVAEAEAEVKLAEAERDKAKVQVDFATITSPYDGVVTYRSLHEGDMARSVAEGGGQTPLFTVDETKLIRVVVQVPDLDVPHVKVGNRAIVQIEALQNKKFPGYVSRKANAEDPQTRLMRVEVDLPNPNGEIKSGMFGRVTIVLTHSDALTVPASCLVGPVVNRQAKVFVVRDGRARLTTVEIGGRDAQRVEVLKGVTAHSAVIVSPPRDLHDGASVTVTGGGDEVADEH